MLRSTIDFPLPVFDNADEKWPFFMGALAQKGFVGLTSHDLAGVPTMGHPQRKLLVCRLMTEIIPESSEAHCFLGHAYRDLGRFTEALSSYDNAIRYGKPHLHHQHIRNDVATYRLYKAETLIEMRQHGEAFVEALLARELIFSGPNPLEHLAIRANECFQVCSSIIAP